MKQGKKKKNAADIYHECPISVDPNGSYTGRSKDPQDKPVQDADDL